MSNDTAQHRYDIADELLLPNEYILQITQIDNVLYFATRNGVEYSARLTKLGRLKKNSVRLNQ